ncbi:acetylglutamate kinase [Desertibacillus haloalkaliphilus]|uniref:acetylglutamate kinase n=1 Tax=Desertibacillus haloalkaliphilus TaxID=1328930 RepID=UPI001C268265|nr:acetylglutamate kinase [Desertibacillus haloalkaliphilus]MBU8908343.1 acetylglutamate kinase [Desertibacillus haloalkaliphilus]
MSEIVVVKCGGSTIAELSNDFFLSIKALQNAGKSPIIVHGGGPEINKMLTKLEIESEFINGLRKTTEDVLDTAEMVLCGKVNKRLVSKFQAVGLNSVGLSGCDGKLLKAEPLDKENLGFVGEAVNVNADLLEQMIENKIIPVIAPIGYGDDGERYNINADSAAGAVADGVGASELVFVTDVPGILDDGQLLEQVTISEVENMIENGTIYGGMIPKVTAAIKSLQGNIHAVMIINGKGSTLDQQGEIVGTKLTKGKVTTQV